MASDPTGTGDPDTIITGDLNSYAMEDPIDVLVDAGYVDLARLFDGTDTYSYVFDGQSGYLDYALGSPSITRKVTGALPYHINADEPSVLDYNTDFKSPNHVNILYAPHEFRTSDHDPVLVGIPGSECETDPPVASATADPARSRADGDMVHVTVSLDVVDASPYTVELVSVVASERVRSNEIVVLDDTSFLLRATSGGPDARVYTITYEATDDCGNVTEFSATFTVSPRRRFRPR